jgi:hypothetical protein
VNEQRDGAAEEGGGKDLTELRKSGWLEGVMISWEGEVRAYIGTRNRLILGVVMGVIRISDWL